jgi:putative component of membrane protein insertase Oxa1/YidC/SpoIIIJ protein YidD
MPLDGAGSRAAAVSALDVDPSPGGGDVPDLLIAFYQRHLRPMRLPGEGCRLRPTCSIFAREALRKWRLLGFILVADRLFIREHPFMDPGYVPLCALHPTGDGGLDDQVP